jgi:autotransporter-associated beta strand protein
VQPAGTYGSTASPAANKNDTWFSGTGTVTAGIPDGTAQLWYWDGGTTDIAANGNGAGTGGNGTWDTTLRNWDVGNVAHSAWNNSAGKTAVFGGTAGTVTIGGGGVTVGDMQLTSANYTIKGDPLTVSGTSNLQINVAADIQSVLAGNFGLTKAGTGTLTLSATNSYTGSTRVTDGFLTCTNSSALGSGALDISSGAKVILNYNGTRGIATLTLGGVVQPAGTYGSTASPAANKNDTWFSGTGTVTAGIPGSTPIGTLSSEAPSDGNTNNHVGTIQATVGDLLETAGSVAGEGAVGDASRHVTASMFNGKISTGLANGSNGGDVNSPTAAGYWTTGSYVEFDLDTTTNTYGYDISAIKIIQRGDSFRPSINVTVSLRTVGSNYFVQLYNTGAVGTGGNVNQVAITDAAAALLGSGIDGVRFDFGDPGLNWTFYRELDVIGTPTSGPTDTTPPTLAASDIVDDRGGAAVAVNTPVTYTVTFSEDMNADTVSADDFSNAGTASVSFGAIVETSPGVFSVAVTPTSAGTLRLQVPVGATMTDVADNPLNTTSAIPDDTEITVEAAAVIATLTSEAANGSPHAGPLINAVSGDLLETVGSVASESVGGAVASQHVTASLFDGKITTGTANGANGGDPDAPNAAGYYGTGHFIEFDLDTTTNTQGYDISLIQIIQRGDHFRPGIHVTVSLRQVGGSYTTLISPPDAGTAGNVNRYAITSGSGPLIASGIDGIRFDFSNTVGTISGWTWYRELDVIGTPTGGGDSYANWAATHAPTTGSNPNADEDGDGVSNGVEYVLGGTIATNDIGKMPTVSSTQDGYMEFTFRRDPASIDGTTAVKIGVSTDLVSWTVGDSPYAVPDGETSMGAVTVRKNQAPDGFDIVRLKIPRAPDAAKFARLKVTVPGS